MAKVELAFDSHCRLGESPVSYSSGALRFVDIEGCKIFEFDSIANRHVREVTTNGKLVGHIVPCASPSLSGYDLLAALDTAIVPVNFEGEDSTSEDCIVVSIPTSHLDAVAKIRLNDGKVDSQGRLWAGSMAVDASRNPNSATKGRLYCLERAVSSSSLQDADEVSSSSYKLVEKLDQVGISNGTDWYGNHMYYIDSLKRVSIALHLSNSQKINISFSVLQKTPRCCTLILTPSSVS
jgi:gluconolactonase